MARRSAPGSASWRNWSGLESASGLRTAAPRSVAEVAAEVRRASARRETVKMAGTGHSFTGIARPEHTQLLPSSLRGITAVDREAGTVTALAGTPLKMLNAELERLGLSLHNMGDIAEQTLAGAISTGTHGTGGRAAGLAAQVVGLELVTGSGEVVTASSSENADVLELARVGLGALGVLTSVTFAVERLFLLRAEERPVPWAEGLAAFDDLVAGHDHVDMYWFPHSEVLLTKRNTRVGTDLSTAAPLPGWRAWLDDELLSNTVFGLQTAALNLLPDALTPRANRLASRLLGPRTYTDVAHRVFTTERRVRFKEMEYGVPREAGLSALTEARRALERSGLRVGFPVEIRVAPADDVPLSTGHGRDTLYLAFHTHRRAPHEEYFAVMEAVLRDHGGRPHWGKLHSLGCSDLAALYPRFGDFLALRDRLDPDRVFDNDYLRRVLGD
ncbi:MAG TPA: D-arabinono-1,4-lactone oxidase [Nocardioides sp.]|nr:D-arabinono-1,4-lactone oxidase [Nocardioides sp.]